MRFYLILIFFFSTKALCNFTEGKKPIGELNECQSCSINYNFTSETRVKNHRIVCSMCYDKTEKKFDWMSTVPFVKDIANEFWRRFVQYQHEYSASVEILGSIHGDNKYRCGFNLWATNAQNLEQRIYFNKPQLKGLKQNYEITELGSGIKYIHFAMESSYISDIRAVCFGFGSKTVYGYKSPVCIDGNLIDACGEQNDDWHKFRPTSGNPYEKHMQFNLYDQGMTGIYTYSPGWFVSAFQGLSTNDVGTLRNFCNSFGISHDDRSNIFECKIIVRDAWKNTWRFESYDPDYMPYYASYDYRLNGPAKFED